MPPKCRSYRVTVGQTDDLTRLKALVLDSVTSPHSRRAYDKALDDFLDWYRSAPRESFTKAVVQEYRAKLEADGLAASTINVRLAAIRKLAQEAADNRCWRRNWRRESHGSAVPKRWELGQGTGSTRNRPNSSSPPPIWKR